MFVFVIIVAMHMVVVVMPMVVVVMPMVVVVMPVVVVVMPVVVMMMPVVVMMMPVAVPMVLMCTGCIGPHMGAHTWYYGSYEAARSHSPKTAKEQPRDNDHRGFFPPRGMFCCPVMNFSSV